MNFIYLILLDLFRKDQYQLKIALGVVLIFMFSQCSDNKKRLLNVFETGQDTLRISTYKKKGAYPGFSYGGGYIGWAFEIDSIIDIKYPTDLDDMESTFEGVDFKPFTYNDFKEGMIDSTILAEYIRTDHLDTTTIEPLDLKKNSIVFVKGSFQNEDVFIADANYNKDLSDDQRFPVKPLDWTEMDSLIPVKYLIREDTSFIEDSSWLNVGLHNDGMISFVSQHVLGDFTIGTTKYTICIVDGQSGYTFDQPKLALINGEEVMKDSVVLGDLITIGEYLALGNDYYQFVDISNTGKYLTLVKRSDFALKKGTQVGMLAPDFRVTTIDGRQISNSDYKNSDYLIANISGCTPESYIQYQELLNELPGQLKVLSIESGVPKVIQGDIVNVEDPVNKVFYENYRDGYSSYNCYLIKGNGRIVDKFDVFDWREHLSEYKYLKD